MNKKAQTGWAMLFVVFIGLVAGLALYEAVVSNVGAVTTASSHTNLTVTMGANGSRVDLDGQELLNTPEVYNATGGELVTSGNYTIDETVSATTGVKTISILTPANSNYMSVPVNVTYEYGADGYIASSGGRSMALLIPIFAALALAVFALSPTIRGNFADLIKGI